MNFIENYFKFSIETKSQSNIEKFYNHKYGNTMNNHEKEIIENIDPEIYKKLKNFFFKYNKNADTKSFTNSIYKRTEFDIQRLITKEDLLWLMYKEGNKKDYKDYIKDRFESNDDIFYYPVQWKTFIEIICQILNESNNHLLTCKVEKESEELLDKILADLKFKIEDKKVNFKLYQSAFTKTKTNIVLNTLKRIFIDSRSPEISIVNEKNNLI
jgi:hypothetical protein